ncbi:unnamed protein product [Paramecium primaurelia]|uniref:Uncharacterized protein n=1 Tax=Paramecium primaurelia TaxID=5886 RepID=A0A8S1MPM7_PARPR|nr:unnamed protein product [Paramecium primaurelia]CAD8081276.1 unnamed protein product [Paramecium primaurelia]CAD8081282.1 unnamed protein product [Paramecium primaurelia]
MIKLKLIQHIQKAIIIQFLISRQKYVQFLNHQFQFLSIYIIQFPQFYDIQGQIIAKFEFILLLKKSCIQIFSKNVDY